MRPTPNDNAEPMTCIRVTAAMWLNCTHRQCRQLEAI